MNGLLVGLGNMGRNHARLIMQTDHELSLVDPRVGGDLDLPEGLKATYATLEEALDQDKYDFAVVAAPSSLHFEISKELMSLSAAAREGKLKGPVDHSVPVLAVRSLDHELKALVFGYACHNTTLSF